MASSTKRKVADANLEDDKDAIDYKQLKVVELKAELDVRGLVKTGRKADLIQRLEESDAAMAQGEVEQEQAESHENEETAYARMQIAATIAAQVESPAKPSAVPGKRKAPKEVKEGWAAMAIPALKAECSRRGISSGGKKPE